MTVRKQFLKNLCSYNLKKLTTKKCKKVNYQGEISVQRG